MRSTYFVLRIFLIGPLRLLRLCGEYVKTLVSLCLCGFFSPGSAGGGEELGGVPGGDAGGIGGVRLAKVDFVTKPLSNAHTT